MLLAPAVASPSPSPTAQAAVLTRPAPARGVLVVDKHITLASLHTPLARWARRDLVPFVVALASLLLAAAPALLYEAQVSWIRSGEELPEEVVEDPALAFNDEDGNQTALAAAATITKEPSAIDLLVGEVFVPADMHFYFMYLVPLYLFLCAIAWLVLYWNVKLQILLRYRDEGGIAAASASGRASHIRVEPIEHGGKSEICKIQRTKVETASGTVSEIFFIFQKTKYILRESGVKPEAGQVSSWFAPLDFPTHDSLQSYLDRANVAGSAAQTAELVRTYGENTFDIPLPPFADLFKEHALAPFFVFQIFCVALWCLDEYWYYSLVTLFMLVMFECTVVQRRLKNLEFLREMRIKPYPVQVWRQGKWTAVPTSDLVPHDLVSLVRPANEQNVIPADVLLLTGSVVVNEAMLTGESVPQVKENADASTDSLADKLEINKTHKRNMLFGGTKILLSNPPSATDAVASGVTIKSPPDGGCIGYVIRTGFNTSQGKLVRTILFSSESVSINNTESLLFIGVLLIFAIAASAYVCLEGLKDEGRSRYKLMLNCIMIITSVVPPELPMELSLAVNTSLLALMRQNIFCTEPFRIPLAGAVDVCCFDKTGTLTSDEFIVKGIAAVKPASASSSSSSNSEDSALITSHAQLPLTSKYVIAGCHSLAFLPESASTGSNPMDSLIGDPLEKSALVFVDWTIGRQETASNKSGRERLRLLHKFPFSSSLKRMSAVVALEHEPGANLRVVTKGAAEVMQSMFDPASLPADYAQVHGSYSQQGCRVLALGWKELDGVNDLPDHRRTLKGMSRDSAESMLQFGGFLVLQCPLKKDSLDVITQLKQSTHQVMMITGDSDLTGCHVAQELGITTKTTIILKLESNAAAGTSQLVWHKNTLVPEDTLPFSPDFTPKSLKTLCAQYDLAITGDALEHLMHTVQEQMTNRGENGLAGTESIALLVSHTKVFARASPDQKELIVRWLKSRGLTVLMCGDGSNDVGSLKQAHIGVALISDDAVKAMEKKRETALANKAAGKAPVPTVQTQLQKIKAAQAAQAAAAAGANSTTGGAKGTLQQQLQEKVKQMEAEMAAEENLTPRLGDASIASPFTSKLPFITSCVDIIRQGRCTLVTTLQMFNILGINCLISAYSMSVLYLQGVKWGDTQMTIASISIAMFFFFLSRAQPLKQLSAERPHKRLFTPSMILSVLGQFGIHMAVLLTAIQSATPHTPTTVDHTSPDKTFKPNVLNTVVYLVSTTQTVATFAANYRGRPFMEGLTENKALFKALTFTFGLMLLLTSEFVPSLNAQLELHELPTPEFRLELMTLLLLDVGVTYTYSQFLRRVFAIRPTAEQLLEAASVAANPPKQSASIELALKKHQ